MLLVLHELGTQPQPRERRPKIVGDRRKHPRAILQEPSEPFLHLIERPCRHTKLARPPLGKLRHILSRAQLLRFARPKSSIGSASLRAATTDSSPMIRNEIPALTATRSQECLKLPA